MTTSTPVEPPYPTEALQVLFSPGRLPDCIDTVSILGDMAKHLPGVSESDVAAIIG